MKRRNVSLALEGFDAPQEPEPEVSNRGAQRAPLASSDVVHRTACGRHERHHGCLYYNRDLYDMLVHTDPLRAAPAPNYIHTY
ncbi:MAG: hypothetical protein Tsb002_03680 [Wenzhouxiangellaceae bacterium]